MVCLRLKNILVLIIYLVELVERNFQIQNKKKLNCFNCRLGHCFLCCFQLVGGSCHCCCPAAEKTSEAMYNFTEAVNESEASTALGQNISEETTTELVKLFTKSMNKNVLFDIHMYGLIILIPLGIIFNSISLIIFQKCLVFSTSIGNHLKCISISDSIVLMGIFLMNIDKYWEEQLKIPVIVSMNNVSCKMSTYVLNVGLLATGLILSSATIERFLAIAFPLKYRSWNTNRTSKIMLSVLFTFSSGVSIFCLFVLGITENGECNVIAKHRKNYDIMFTIVTMVIANGICGGIILIFTIIIISLLFRQLRRRNVLSHNSENSSSKKEVRISVMLVSVSVLFILLRYPKLITLKFLSTTNSRNPLLIKSVSKLGTFFVAVNHSVNFIIYMIYLGSFRRTFCKMFSWLHVKVIECLYICTGGSTEEG